MKVYRLFASAAAAAAVFTAPPAPAREVPKVNPVYEAAAQKLVNQAAAVKEGEIVVIAGDVRDMELLEAVVVSVRKLGAFPLLQVGTDRLTRRLWTEVPEKYDGQAPSLDLKLANIADVYLGVGGSYDPGLLADIPAERLAVASKAAMPIGETLIKRGVRQVSLGNGMFPTPAVAKQYGLSQKALSKLFWDGVNVDYDALHTTGEAVRSVLAGGREVHVTNPNGTDIRFRIEDRPVVVSDGLMTPDRIQKGGAAVQAYLPAGEVMVSPVPGTADGKIVVDRMPFEDQEIIGMVMTFAAGKMTSMTAKSGFDRKKASYDAAGAGKDEFGVLDIGINPNVRIPKGSRLVTWMPAGMVTFGVGNNLWAGGDNNSAYGSVVFVPGCTVTVDGKTIVEDGNLKV